MSFADRLDSDPVADVELSLAVTVAGPRFSGRAAR